MIRTGEKRDIPELLDIYNYEVINGVATFDLMEKNQQEWEQWFQAHQGNYPLLVFESEEGIAGYATLSPYRDKEAYLGTAELSVYVKSGCQGKGIGTALIGEILEMARCSPVLHTVVSVITGGNDRSTYVHEKFGFSYCGKVREAGYKFQRFLDIETYQIMVG